MKNYDLCKNGRPKATINLNILAWQMILLYAFGNIFEMDHIAKKPHAVVLTGDWRKKKISHPCVQSACLLVCSANCVSRFGVQY